MRRSVLLKTAWLVAAALSAALVGVPRAAEKFVAQLNGANAGTSSTASGLATLTLREDLSAIDYVVTFTGLSATEVGAHVHRGDRSIAYDLGLGTTKVGTWLSPSLADVTQLRNNQFYVNIHTAAYPSGEIRGTLIFQQVPVDSATWSRIKALYR